MVEEERAEEKREEEVEEKEEGGGKYITLSEQSFLHFMTLMLEIKTCLFFFLFLLNLANTCVADRGGSDPHNLHLASQQRHTHAQTHAYTHTVSVVKIERAPGLLDGFYQLQQLCLSFPLLFEGLLTNSPVTSD